MLYATNIFPGDGSTRQFEITFVGGYLNKSHVKVYVEDAVTKMRRTIDMGTVTWIGPYTIQLPEATPVGSNTVIARQTPLLPIVDFQGSSRITEANLDVAHRQGLFVATESLDSTNSKVVEELKEVLLNTETWEQAAADAGVATTKAAEAASSAAASAASAGALALSTGSGNVGHIGSGAGAVASTVRDKLRSWVLAYEYGALGSVADETANLQAALNAAAGSTLELSASATYNYTFLTIPQNTRVVSNGCKFNRISASTSHGIVIEAGVRIDRLYITTPGGSGGDKAVAIRGSNVLIDDMSVIASAQGIVGGVNYAIEIGSQPANTKLDNIMIRALHVKYFSTGVFAKYVSRLSINYALIEYYRTGIYLRDVGSSELANVVCRLTGAAATGGPGENGLLVESTLASGTCNDLRFTNWSVANSPEHGYRFGGSLNITNVWLTNCRSALTGGGGAGATGGSGFKVLGYGGAGGERHTNFFFTNCEAQDVSTTGGGQGNFAGFLLGNTKNVHLTSCDVTARSNPYSCWHGISADSVRDLFITNSNVSAARQQVLRLSAGVNAAFPSTEGVIDNVNIVGGVYSLAPGAATAVRFDWDGYNSGGTISNVTITGATISGGLHALRSETGITTSGNNLEFNYINCEANPATAVEPVVYGSPAGVLNITAPWLPLAFTPPAYNGSSWKDTSASPVVREFRESTWIHRDRKYQLTIPDDGVATIVPPMNFGGSPGFLAITGSSASHQMLLWFRSSATPAGSKYAGAATSVVVSTALTGTTGTAGNLTVGIQSGLIYVENRSGTLGTFSLSFL